MVQRVPGHEKATTTLDLHPRRADVRHRILRALDDRSGEDPDVTSTGRCGAGLRAMLGMRTPRMTNAPSSGLCPSP